MRTTATEASELEQALKAAGRDPDLAFDIWDLWQRSGIRAALHELEQQAMTTDTEIRVLEARRTELAPLLGPPIIGQTDFAARRAAHDEDSAIADALQPLYAQQEAERQAAARRAQIRTLAAHATAGQQALAALETARAAFDAAVLPALEAYSAALVQHTAARRAFYGDLNGIPIADIEAAGADVGAVLLNLIEPRDRAHDRRGALAPARFPGALTQALREETVHRLGHPLPPDSLIHVLPERKMNQ